MRNDARQATASSTTEVPPTSNTRSIDRSRQAASVSGYQSLIMPAMVTLGCLGLAISFSFFTTDANRFLYGGIAAVMAVMWAISFWLRLLKVRQQR